MLFGPLRAHGFGLLDGEENKRDWSSKRHLIAAGRDSSSARRAQLINSQNIHCAQTKRRGQVRLLMKRHKRTDRLVKDAKTALNSLYGTVV